MSIIKNLATEKRNKNTKNIDKLSTYEMVELINKEDEAVIEAVRSQLKPISEAVDTVYEAISGGGRLIYMGAGTSGRLGVLDASEWFPTYGVGDESVVGIIAGGDYALRNPIEGAEDFEDSGREDLKKLNLNDKDVVCALASSGRTPYCIGGLKYANELGCKTISIANVENSKIGEYADHVIEAVTGPEVVTGSTRMKAGSAQKMILNTISTSTMIKYGKVYENLMVDVNPSNEKLVERAYSIISDATGVDYDRSKELLEASDNNVKAAIVMEKMNCDLDKALTLIDQYKGKLGDIFDKE